MSKDQFSCGGRQTRTIFPVLLSAMVWLAASGWAQQASPPGQSGAGGAPAAPSAPRSSGSLINESLLVGLPLNGRSYSQLATLEAGVSDPSAASGSRGIGGGNLNVNGGRASSNSFLLDGTNIMDTANRSPRSAAGVQLGTDSVLQVMVFATTYSAEYGRGSGGVLNSITRSGANEFHLSLFEFLRNSKLDARSFFDGAEPPPFKRNQFGFTATGPLRSDKTFIMGSFEAMRDRLTENQLDTFIDSYARQGIITNSAGVPIRTMAVFPSIMPYLNLMPLPNLEFNGGRLGGGLAQNLSPQYLPTDEEFYTVRVDHALSQRTALFGRYTFDDASSIRGGGIFAFGSRVKTRQQYATLVGSHIFSTRMVASFRLGYTRPVDQTISTSQIDIPRELYFVPDAPQFGQLSVPGTVSFGPLFTAPETNRMNSFQYSGDVILQRGPHGIKMGAEIHRYRWDVSSSANKSGIWSFNSLDSFLQGGPDGTSITVALPGSDNTKAWRQTLLGFYVQDDYRLRPSVSLNLGLRYEVATLIHDRLGRTSYLDDILTGTRMEVGPLLDHNPSTGNLSPRIGLAWAPGRSTSINAGFGIYYDQQMGYAVDTQKNMAPFYRIAINPNFDARATFPNAVAGALASASGQPQQAQALAYRDFTTPRVMRYEFSVTRRLPLQSSLQIGYVGARGNHLWRNLETNLFPPPVRRPDGLLFFPAGDARINPAFQSGINLMNSDAQSFYNSLLLTADSRLTRALNVRMSYTLSKTIDDASNIGTSASAQQYGLDRTLDRGPSDFDNRQRVSASFFYSLPAGKGGSGLLPVVGGILGGWRLGGIFSFRTSVPTTARINVRRAGYLFAATRPNLVSGQSNNPRRATSIGCQDPITGEEFLKPGAVIREPDMFFDPCAFALPEAGTIGNVGRATIYGPSLVNLDVSLQRDFSLGGDRRLQFRTEFFNLANHVNYRTPTASSMVIFTGRGFNPGVGRYVSPATTARQVQFALRLSF